MIVMKFGGSSIGTPDRVKNVVSLVSERQDRSPVVVLSAFSGVTNALTELAHQAVESEPSLDALRARHTEMAEGLGLPADIVSSLLDELGILLKGISLVKELTPRTLDYVLSFGERMSIRMVAAYLNQTGVAARAFDAFDIGMLTDDQFGSALPLNESEGLLRSHLGGVEGIPVISGYIGRTAGGDITTLGRNGSDFTASIVGAAINADEIQIWTDVDGVMSADPTLVPDARSIEVMTFAEASELAWYGGRVLHPSTLVPAIRKEIPVRVLNALHPESKGTLVVANDDSGRGGIVKSVVYKEGQTMVTIRSERMFMRHGFMASIFEIFGRHRVSVNMIATSEVSVSVTVDQPDNLDAAVKEIEEFATVVAEPKRTMVCVVGEGLRDTQGISGEVFSAMADAGVNILMISQGASKINVAFVIDDADVKTAVTALHARFFPKVTA